MDCIIYKTLEKLQNERAKLKNRINMRIASEDEIRISFILENQIILLQDIIQENEKEKEILNVEYE